MQAVLGTQESAEAGGHHLKSIGVTWTDHTDASALREALDAHGISDVMLVSELHAAGALATGAPAARSATAPPRCCSSTATPPPCRWSDAEDGSVVKVLSRSLHSTDAMAVLADMAAAVAGRDTAPEGMFVVGSGVDVSSVKRTSVRSRRHPGQRPGGIRTGAGARAAASTSASAPAFEASTVGLAYSLAGRPDGPTAGSVLAAAADTQLAQSSVPNYVDLPDDLAGLDVEPAPRNRGTSRSSWWAAHGVDLRDRRRRPGDLAGRRVSARPPMSGPLRRAPRSAPSVQAPAPARGSRGAARCNLPRLRPAAAETIKAPIPVVQQAPRQAPRRVYVERAPAPQAPAPAPAPVAPPPAPARSRRRWCRRCGPRRWCCRRR